MDKVLGGCLLVIELLVLIDVDFIDVLNVLQKFELWWYVILLDYLNDFEVIIWLGEVVLDWYLEIVGECDGWLVVDVMVKWGVECCVDVYVFFDEDLEGEFESVFVCEWYDLLFMFEQVVKCVKVL